LDRHDEHVHPDVAAALDRLVEMARTRQPDDDVLAQLLPEYYRELPEADVDGRRLDDMYAVGVAHLALGRRRRPGQTLVRVASPDLERDGWYSRRSVLLVVTDDAPFLVDTVRMVLDRNGLGIHLLVHPMLDVRRDDDGCIVGLGESTGDGTPIVEAWTQVEIDRCDDAAADWLEAEVRAVVDDVHRVVSDFPTMRSRLAAFGDVDPLLSWLAAEHFVFLGAASYDLSASGELVVRDGSQLGQLRSDDQVDPPAVAEQSVAGTHSFAFSRSDGVATIHRAARRTCISVADDDGVRHRFLGLLASSVYRQSVLSIPTIGDRARAVLGLADAGAETHTGRSMRNVLETLPRELLFELDADALAHLVIDIVGLQERQVVRLFDVPEPVGPWSTVLVYLPRSRFSAEVPARVAAAVARAYGTTVRDLESLVSASSLARITFTVRRPDDAPAPDLEHLAAEIDELTTSWDERLAAVLALQLGDSPAAATMERIAAVAPVDYRASVPPRRAVGDLERIVHLLEADAPVTTALSREVDAPADEWRFRVYRRDHPATLSELLPLLDHLGLTALDQHPYRFDVDGRRVHVYDIGVQLPPGVELDAARHAELLSTFEALVAGEVEADGLNRLVALAGLTAHQVSVIRAYSRYLRQIGFPFSQQYIEHTLAKHHAVVSGLVRLFEARFDPDAADREAAATTARLELLESLDQIQVLDDDRICRAFQRLIDATLRTNAFRDTATIAFKLDPREVPDLPEPRPMFEIFVCSPRVEGVHLRGGPIARGGLRWSDRREDFRTEVLGLVKAQMVKNAVIVPVGAKGGFVVKRVPADPGALRDEAVECYRSFVRSMLDLTDNVVGGEIVHPARTVRFDGDDPYLVVAADKGTATFSDIANAVAAEYDFWLGDAFASGGSVGYDHKAMGITARGAWESVRRHARVLGKNVDTDTLTVVGIGDMSGDVFGNGMLRSRHIALVAAFDHRHVFLDPDPDTERSFVERKRLFDLPRSSWADYDPTLISAGGGVFSRALKSIEISPEVRAVLAIDADQLTPLELIRAILAAPVDLLWNGGIGTYVRASTETDAEVGDRANDHVRIPATALRCRMVAEGGNLGLTQSARVEYALSGGLVYTDAIDNSAGVDCSDHEVNIKILLDEVVKDGELTMKQRNELLASMTDEVAELVLDNNRAQTLALMIARRQALPMVNVHARYLDQLEAEGWLDRDLEDLPTDKQIAERQAAGSGLRAPEFAVMIAYTKNADVSEILLSDLPDDAALERDLFEYFPGALRERYPDVIRRHRLRREIVATQIVNQMVNLSGISYDHRMTEDTGATVVDVMRAWIAARDSLGFARAWAEIDELGRSIDLEMQLELFLDARRTAERCSLWLLRHRRPPLDIVDAVETFRDALDWLTYHLHEALSGPMAHAASSAEQTRLAAGVPPDLAKRSAVWRLLHTGFDLVDISNRLGVTLSDVAHAYWTMFDRLELMWLWDGIGALPRYDRWQTQARSALRDDLLTVLADLAGAVMVEAGGSADKWLASNERSVGRMLGMFAEIRRAESYDLTTLSVALRQLRNLGLTSAQAI
jgi:glutamate dehydrogenase